MSKDLRGVHKDYRDVARSLINDGCTLLHGTTHLYVLSPRGHKVGTIPRHGGGRMKPEALLAKIRRRVEL